MSDLHVAVPKHDLEKIEKARVRLHELANFFNLNAYERSMLLQVTVPMWEVSHTRYKKVD